MQAPGLITHRKPRTRHRTIRVSLLACDTPPDVARTEKLYVPGEISFEPPEAHPATQPIEKHRSMRMAARPSCRRAPRIRGTGRYFPIPTQKNSISAAIPNVASRITREIGPENGTATDISEGETLTENMPGTPAVDLIVPAGPLQVLSVGAPVQAIATFMGSFDLNPPLTDTCSA